MQKMTREEALQLIDQHISIVTRRRHMTAVATIMRGLAEKLGMNALDWELVGLLHDLDHDLVKGNMRKHGLVAAKMLEGKLSEECLHAIRAHDYRTGVKPESILDKALITADCFSILIEHVTCHTSHGRIEEVTLNDLKNTLEDKSFPQFLKNGIMQCRDFGLSLDDFLETALMATPRNLIISEDNL